jgi:2,6-dihydroxypyridine 3-monooxygenase
VLHDAFPGERYRLGHEVVDFEASEDGAELTFADGSTTATDLLVCADGIGSPARRRLFPDVAPQYAGYVAWRGTVPETALSGPAHDALHDALTYQVLPHSHVLVYPIPGLDGAVEQGQRLMNLVWYRNVPAPELEDFLTDRHGTRREVSLPPGHVRTEQVEELRSFAAEHLAPSIAEVVTGATEPFVQAVFDIEVPRMASGRACLVGDAAFAVRPHAAAGTAKAAEDGWVLAEELVRAEGDVASAMRRWEARQVDLGRGLLARTREIGVSSQTRGDFRPGDPRLVFGLHGPGR